MWQTHPFNGPFSGTTLVSRYQKGKTNRDFTEARDSEWQWHQLGHMQVCISLQTDNHASTPPLNNNTHLTSLFPGLSRWAGTRKAKPIWILLKQETVSGSGISWAVCKSAPSSRQITMAAPHHSVFYRPDALPAAQRTASKHFVFLPSVHWRMCVCVYLYSAKGRNFRAAHLISDSLSPVLNLCDTVVGFIFWCC